MRLSIKQLTLTITFLAALASGCIKHTTVIPANQRLLPAQSKSRDDLMADLTARSAALETLSAKVTLDATGGSLKTGVMEDYRQTTGFIIAERPDQLRVKVNVVGFTVFDMAAKGKEYRASIPPKNLFMFANSDAPSTSSNPLGNLRPKHLLEALFVDIRPYLANPKIKPYVEEFIEGRISYYVLNFVDISGPWAELREKFWIDRTNLQIVRKQTFADGKLEEDVEFSGYETIGSVMFPTVVLMHRPVEDYSLKITFLTDKLTLNEKLPPENFLLEQPAGSQVMGMQAKPPEKRQ